MKEDDILAMLSGVESHGKSSMAQCPGHNDHTASLKISVKDNGWIDLHCFAGCAQDSILGKLGLINSDLNTNNGHKGYSNNGGDGCQRGNTRDNGVDKQAQQPVITSVSTTVAAFVDNGLTVAELAEAKHLDPDFLKSLGVKDFKKDTLPAIRIPWYGAQGQEVSVHIRIAMKVDRFRWRSGDKAAAIPYGLNRLPQIKKAGWLLIVEGESDCWTCWAKDIPAMGAPGKGIFPAAWGEYLDGLDVYIWQEPAAEGFTKLIYKAAPHAKVIIAPQDTKDISAAHIAGKDIVALLEELKAKAAPVADLVRQVNDTEAAALYQKARAIIESIDPLILIEDAIRAAGYGGDIRPAIITYYAATSRLLAMREGAMPVHLLLAGLTSAGKSFTLRTTLWLLPAEAYHIIDAGSAAVLIYDDADLQHRVLVFGEADSLPAGEDNPAASAVRNLLQDHCLHYQVTIKDKETGDYTVRRIEKPGPTVLITTSTKPLGDQLNSRFFTLECSDTAEQIAAALGAQANLELDCDARATNDQMVAFQSYLQLKAPWRVYVPFARELATAMGKMQAAPRILRDYARLMSLIKTVAILRHHNRRTDDSGRTVAQLEDYEIIRSLIGEMYVESTTGAAANIRQLVEAVEQLEATRSDSEIITNTILSKHLGIGIKQVTRRAKKAMRQGWLANKEQRKSYPANYAIGEPMPPTDGLPVLTVDTLAVNDNGNTRKNDDSLVLSEDTPTNVDTLTPQTEVYINKDIEEPPHALADDPPPGGRPADFLEPWEIDAGVTLGPAGERMIGATNGRT
jgi:hypothetical protein